MARLLKLTHKQSVLRVLSVFGTRPEAVKMAPVVRALQADPLFQSRIVVTGQHREMLDQVLEHFALHPDYDLHLMQPRQTLHDLLARIVQGLNPILHKERPHLVLVHGDTSTCFGGALAAFYYGIPVGHVEAGLRTGQRDDPFPEEMHRRLTTSLTSLHFAPTAQAKQNLLAEGIREQDIVLTGNTVIDALKWTVRPNHRYFSPELERLATSTRKLILVTAHRRENLGAPLDRLCLSIRRIVARHENVEVVFPMHKNPRVREQVKGHLDDCERVSLLEPPGYADFANLMQRVFLVLTDSGGLQEEAPALGKPVLVLRDTTERPEGIAAGTSILVGTECDAIESAVDRLLLDAAAYDGIARVINPFGDGRAAERIVERLRLFGAQRQTSQ